MKTLIVYTTKYGTTEKCAKLLEEKLQGEVTLLNLGLEKSGDLSEFSVIIIGSGINFGKINKTLKDFLSSNISELLEKELGLFLCCGFPENAEQLFKTSFTSELLAHAKAVECFGGEMDIDKLSGVDKMIAKAVTSSANKQGKRQPELDFEKIQKFAEAFYE